MPNPLISPKMRRGRLQRLLPNVGEAFVVPTKRGHVTLTNGNGASHGEARWSGLDYYVIRLRSEPCSVRAAEKADLARARQPIERLDVWDLSVTFHLEVRDPAAFFDDVGPDRDPCKEAETAVIAALKALAETHLYAEIAGLRREVRVLAVGPAAGLVVVVDDSRVDLDSASLERRQFEDKVLVGAGQERAVDTVRYERIRWIAEKYDLALDGLTALQLASAKQLDAAEIKELRARLREEHGENLERLYGFFLGLQKEGLLLNEQHEELLEFVGSLAKNATARPFGPVSLNPFAPKAVEDTADPALDAGEDTVDLSDAEFQDATERSVAPSTDPPVQTT